MRADRKFPVLRSRSRQRHLGKMILLPVMATACIVVAAYLVLFPTSNSSLPFSSTIPASAAALPVRTEFTEPPQSPPDPPEKERVESSTELIEVTGEGDTLYSLLSSNLSDEATARNVTLQMASVIQERLKGTLRKPFDGNTPLESDTRYRIVLGPDGQFLKLTLEWDAAHVFHAVAKKTGVKAWQEEVVLEFKKETLAVVLEDSLSETFQRASEGTILASELEKVFRYDINFHSDPRKGDVCKILFERRYADDRPSGYGRILYAEYVGRKTKRKTAVLFDGKYYDEKGVALTKPFLKSPLSQIRVTSRFGRRLHPIRKVWHNHKGVDYGAPTGTPVWSVAGGTVKFAGWARGFGNWVCIKHANGYESQYGHLSKILVRKGQAVKQRQRIGLVGATGDATGPHLDFRLLVKAHFVDPLKVKMVKTDEHVATDLKKRFAEVLQERRGSLGHPVAASYPRSNALAALQ